MILARSLKRVRHARGDWSLSGVESRLAQPSECGWRTKSERGPIRNVIGAGITAVGLVALLLNIDERSRRSLPRCKSLWNPDNSLIPRLDQSFDRFLSKVPGFTDLGTERVQLLSNESEHVSNIVGIGSYGEVHLGKDLDLDETIAVKVIKETDATRDTIRNEVSALLHIQNLGGHDNVVDFKRLVTKQCRDEREHWLIFEHVKGKELFHHICDNGPVCVVEAANILKQLSRAVDFLHAKAKVAHLDIKPENILIDKESKIKLIDFGSSRPVVAQSKDCSNVNVVKKLSQHDLRSIGTSAYSSPEILKGETNEITTSSDIFSMGCLAYILLTGRHPFDPHGNRSVREMSMSIMEEKPLFDEQVWKKQPKVQDLVLSMLEKDPSKRVSLADLISQLDKL